MSTVEEFRYAGGWTSTGPALELCRNELADSVGERTIILLTDGTPTRPDSEGTGAPYTEATDYATEQADAAKEDDITVITVYVNTATGTSSYLESLASPGNFIEVNDFDNLDEVQERLLGLVQCS
jgi:Mg-chelatase subunit ChlD